MISYIKSTNILPATQSGFCTGYSCETTLLKVTDDIIDATDKGLISYKYENSWS